MWALCPGCRVSTKSCPLSSRWLTTIGGGGGGGSSGGSDMGRRGSRWAGRRYWWRTGGRRIYWWFARQWASGILQGKISWSSLTNTTATIERVLRVGGQGVAGLPLSILPSMAPALSFTKMKPGKDDSKRRWCRLLLDPLHLHAKSTPASYDGLPHVDSHSSLVEGGTHNTHQLLGSREAHWAGMERVVGVEHLMSKL